MLKEIWRLPVPSTGLLGAGVALQKRLGREICLRYEIEGSTGEAKEQVIAFEGVESFKCTFGQACTEWMFSAYDRLVEVTDSPWMREITERLVQAGGREVSLRHLMIYFDDGPCYEVVCRAFRIEGG